MLQYGLKVPVAQLNAACDWLEDQRINYEIWNPEAILAGSEIAEVEFALESEREALRDFLADIHHVCF